MDDPLAGMRLTGDYFGRLMRAIADVANATARGRLVAVTEGGYDLAGLAGSLRASLAALTDEAIGLNQPTGETPRGEATMKAVTPHVSKYWKL
jgi:acetoin utilization deacetylase AcuC-like enzyme